jgi:prepilin-type N-terminal cleavage/methylation domain-containing protein
MSRRRVHLIRRRRGMGLVELLVSLAIAASLLTATGVALNASFAAYQVNQQQATLLQSTRLTMNRILSTIRRCKLHAPDTSSQATQFAIGATVTDTGIDMFDANDVETIYRYDAANKRILFIAGGTTHPLLEGVESFNVTLEPMRSAESVRTGGPWDLLRRATIWVSV